MREIDAMKPAPWASAMLNEMKGDKMSKDKIEATIQVSLLTCRKYVEDWESFCKDLCLNNSMIECMSEDTQINLTLEQAKTHGII